MYRNSMTKWRIDMDGPYEYDAVIAGASIAGCSTAILFARAGLRVALVERKNDVDSYKAMCGHWILGGTKPTLERMGLWDAMVDAGASVAWATVWSGDGWIEPDIVNVPPATGLRRSTLDPMLRRLAIATEGIDVHLGAEVRDLVRDSTGRIVGLSALTANGPRAFTGRLVVGADGHRSAVARLAEVPESPAPNGRFFWWAYYRGLDVPGDARVWPADPDGAVVVPAGDDLHLVGAFPSKVHLPAFHHDRLAAIERYVAQLPDAPRLAGAERVSKAIGTNDYPFVRRDPLPRPGLALVGDAAMASDPLPAVGCGWAFRSAEWLVDAATPGLRDGEDLDACLERYRDARAVIETYDDLARGGASTLTSSDAQRALLRAAVHDRDLATRLGLFAARAAAPDILLNADVARRASVAVA
jgi:2-polyprenyl-6-methoxyphenol hydroxylase-like FAD-dependent oxidoreductase